MRAYSIRSFVTLIVLLQCLSLELPAQSTKESPSGWEIYLAARETVGAKSDNAPIRDYTFDLKTTVDADGKPRQIESSVWYLVPGFVRQQIQSPQGVVSVIFDGEKGWREIESGIQPMPEDAVGRIRADLARSHVMLAPPPERSDVRFLRSEEVDGRPASVIEIRDVGGTPLRLYVDVDSHDVVKQVFMGDAPDGTMSQVEEFYSDFREIGGYRWHHKRKVVRNGKPALESETSNLKVNSGLTKSDILR